jgi:hypothetical protein
MPNMHAFRWGQRFGAGNRQNKEVNAIQICEASILLAALTSPRQSWGLLGPSCQLGGTQSVGHTRQLHPSLSCTLVKSMPCEQLATQTKATDAVRRRHLAV